MTVKSKTTAIAEPADLNEPELRKHAVLAAQGKADFDLLICGGTVIDMVTRQLRQADIGVVGPLIASVHTSGQWSGAKHILDASGTFLSPGLIDTHLHIESSMITPAAYAREVLPRGVTTVVWDPHEFANTCGVQGMDYALQSTACIPLRVLTLAPSSVPSAPGYETTGADFTPHVLTDLLANEGIAGVGEMMSMQAVLDNDLRFAGIVQSGLQSGKRVCGHARGLDGSQLNAYVAAGIETDHELTSADDLEAKLQAGLTIEMRGSHDHLLPEFVQRLNAMAQFPQTVTLCTDDVFPDDLVGQGGLDDVIRRLVRYGLNPISALQAATMNAAVRIGRSDLGLLAPGKRADIVLFRDLEAFTAVHVVTNGESTASDGEVLSPVTDVTPPPSMQDTMQNSKQNKTQNITLNAARNATQSALYSAADFFVSASGASADVVVIQRPRFTQWNERSLPVVKGKVQRPDDLTCMAVINRFGLSSTLQLAFLGEWGQWNGAFATTVSHDSHNLTVFGDNEADMAIVANKVTEMGGGLAVAKNGGIIASLALPLAGLVSRAPLKDIAGDFRAVRKAMDQVVVWNPPYLVFKACFGASLVCNPGPRLSDVGIVDTSLCHRQTSPLGRRPDVQT